MKNKLLILALLCFSFMACKDKKEADTSQNNELKEDIMKVEQENEALKSLENDIENDIKELDELLKEVDEN